MRRNVRVTGTRQRTFLSFILLALIPIFILSFLFYRYNLDEVKANIEHLNNYQLGQITDILENEYENFFLSARSLEQDPELKLTNLTGGPAGEKSALDAFRNHTGNEKTGVTPFLYARDEQRFFGRDGTMGLDTMLANYYHVAPQDRDMLSEWINDTSAATVRKFHVIDASKHESEKVIFRFPFRGRQVSAFYVLDQSAYLDLFADLTSEVKGYAFLFDDRGNVIASGSRSDENQTRIYKNFVKNGTDTETIKLQDGKKYVISCQKSKTTGWVCAIALPEKAYAVELLKGMNAVAIGIVCVAALGILGAAVLSIALYRPLQRIMQENDIKKEGKDKINEYELLSDYFKKTKAKTRKLVEVIHSQNPYVTERVLDILLYGSISRETFEEEIEHLHIGFDGRYFFSVVLEITEEINPVDYSHLARAVMDLVTASGDNPVLPFSAYCLEYPGKQQLAIVVNMHGMEQKEYIYDQLKEEIRACVAHSVCLVFGCGKAYDTMWGIRKSYQEAKVVSEHNRNSENRKISVIDDMQQINPVEIFDYPIEKQSLFLQQTKQGDYESAKTSFLEIFDHAAFQKGSSAIMQYIFDCITSEVVQAAKTSACFSESCNLSYILAYKDAAGFQKNILRATKEICETVNRNRQQSSRQLKEQVLHYIEDNYFDPELGLDMLGEHFGLTPVYLSRFISERTGMNIKDYISKIRIERAKEMLIDTKASVNEIVSKVGYYNASSFIRKFKHIVGVTPGEYRTRAHRRLDESLQTGSETYTDSGV